MRGVSDAGMDRRHFLKHVAGASALVLPGVQFLQTLRAAQPILKKENKSLIILWMGGGPTQMETWDPKPGSKTGGEFKEIATAVSGIKISEVLPEDKSDVRGVGLALPGPVSSEEGILIAPPALPWVQAVRFNFREWLPKPRNCLSRWFVLSETGWPCPPSSSPSCSGS